MASDVTTTVNTTDASQEFVGKWNTLISTANWEKGKIIANWRQSLINAAARPRDYSDDVWAQLVGGVTPQHVGRLRRVHERFGDQHPSYAGLYWSHFFAALDWDDAEMWLEGAVQNRWSVSKLKRQRWETLGSIPEDDPEMSSAAEEETDEDFEASEEENVAPTISGSVAEVLDLANGKEADEDNQLAKEKPSSAKATSAKGTTSKKDNAESGAAIYAEEDHNSVSFVQSFADLPELPEDLTEAFESFKLAVLRHKLAGWAEVSREDVLAGLDALRELASTPVTESMPS